MVHKKSAQTGILFVLFSAALLFNVSFVFFAHQAGFFTITLGEGEDYCPTIKECESLVRAARKEGEATQQKKETFI